MAVHPPRLAVRFLNWFLKREMQEEVNGDLEERYLLDLEQMSAARANWQYWRQVLHYLRPFAIRNDLITDLNPFFMFRSHWKIAWRNLFKQKRYALLNITGMTIGLCCFILLSLYIQYESSYDQQHQKADRIYRVVQRQIGNEFQGTNEFALSPSCMVPTLLEDFPEVENGTTVSFSNTLFVHNNDAAYENGVFADSAFFEVFDYELIAGNLNSAMADKDALVLTESMARKYFGDSDPIGADLKMENERPVTIKAVIADPPENQHIDFDFVCRIENYGPFRQDFEKWKWGSNNYWAYVVLPPAYDYHELESKMAYLTDVAKPFYNTFSFYPEYFLQPLTSIHLHSKMNMEAGVNGDIAYLYLAGAIGIIILLLALANYINLTTARANQRVHEVGVRKVLGARRAQVVGQFFVESLIVVGISLVIATCLSILLLPGFNELLGLNIELRWLGGTQLLLACVGILVLMVLGAGLYPACLSSLTTPVGAIRGGELQRGGKRNWIAKALVVGQFVAAIVLASGSIIIYQQLEYIQDKKLGYDRDHIVYVPYTDQVVMDKAATFRSELLQHPGIEKVAFTSQVPLTSENQGIATSWEGHPEGAELPIYRNWVDYNYLDLFGIELLSGRNFSPNHPTDATAAYLLNEAAVKALGWKDAVGKSFEEGKVIGVVKNFHFQPFKLSIEPMFIRIYNEYTSRYGNIAVKISGDQQQEAIAHLEKSMKEILPLIPFNLRYLDADYQQLYSSETRFGMVFKIFTALAIFIACLGLLGLVTHQVLDRKKEIGIRKVLGASVSQIVGLISSGFLWQISLAALIAMPLAWWGMQRWLQGFVYRIELNWAVFILVGLATLLIAFLTISSQSIKAALANPVQAIKTD